MDVITLASQPYKIAAITRKTRAELFKDAAVGDILRFSLDMTAPGQRARGGQYATCIRVDNETQGAHTHVTLNEIGKRLGCFDIVPHEPAQIIPFPNPIAETFESFARMARAGGITGAIVAAMGPGRLDEETLSEASCVSYTEQRALIQTLEDAARTAWLDAQDE